MYQWVWSVTWLLSAILGGFVAGYRTAGRGMVAGLLSGVWTAILLGGAFVLIVIDWLKGTAMGMMLELGPAETLRAMMYGFGRFGNQTLLIGVTVILSIALAAWSGLHGESYYQENGGREDPARHTLFAVPWWHWAWLLVFLPGFLISDCMLSGHLFVLATIAIFRHFMLGFIPFLGSLIQGLFYLVGMLGLYATFGGMVNLLGALAVDSGLSTGRRIAKALWGLCLIIVIVNVAWAYASRFLLARLR